MKKEWEEESWKGGRRRGTVGKKKEEREKEKKRAFHSPPFPSLHPLSSCLPLPFATLLPPPPFISSSFLPFPVPETMMRHLDALLKP